MAKNHLKRIAVPSSWPVTRKSGKFIVLPKGAFSVRFGISLASALREMLNFAETAKEVRTILNNREVLVNGVRRKNPKFMIGLMDVLTVKDLGKSYRLLLNSKARLGFVPVSGEEGNVLVCKVIGKRLLKKGGTQLSLHNGHSLLWDKEASASVGDTVVVGVPKQDKPAHFRLEKGCHAYLTGGSHVGCLGVVDHVLADKVMLRIEGELVEAAKRFVFVVGKDKPLIGVSAA